MSLAWDTMAMPAWVWRNPKVKPGAMRDVLVCLLWHQGRNESAWPTVATIAAELGYSDRAVRGAIVSLEAEGFVSVDRSACGRGLASRYRVIERALAAREDPSECRQKPLKILQDAEESSRENPLQNLPSPPAESSADPLQNLPGPPAESAGEKEPFQRTLPVEPDVARAHASAPTRTREASPTPAALTPVGVFKLVDERWLRERGEAIPGGWFGQRHTDACSVIELASRTVGARTPAPTDRDAAALELVEAELAAFIAATQRDSISNPWLLFVRRFGGWAHAKHRSGPEKPGSIEEFDRDFERLVRDGWIDADGGSVERGPSGELPPRPARARSRSRHFAPPPNRPAGEASPWTSDPHEALARLGDGPPARKAVGS